MKALIVKTEGAVEPIEIDGLRDKQRAVGGCIEYFGVFEDRGFTVIINEDGLFTCPPNRAIFGDASLEEAGYLSQFSHEYRPVRDGELYAILCGDFLVVGFDPADARRARPDAGGRGGGARDVRARSVRPGLRSYRRGRLEEERRPECRGRRLPPRCPGLISRGRATGCRAAAGVSCLLSCRRPCLG